MPMPKRTRKKDAQYKKMREGKRRKRIQDEEREIERALWAQMEARMEAEAPEDCDGAADMPEEPSPIAHWDYSAGEDDCSEDELEFTDAEEEDRDQRALPSSTQSYINTASLSMATESAEASPSRHLDKTAFSILMEDREAKMEAIRSVHFKWQRGPTPSKKTVYRKALNKKELAGAARAEQQTAISTFLSEATQANLERPEEDPDAGKNIFVPAKELKAALSEITKKINCRRKGLQLKGQNLFCHEAVKMFLQAQQTRQTHETRLFIAKEVVARCCGRGLYFARKVISWEIEWRKHRTINEGRKGCHAKTFSWFNDEGVQVHIREYLAGAGESITAHSLARSIGEYLDSRRAELAIVSTLETDPDDPDPTLSRRTRIRARTARRFLHRMGFSFKTVTKNVYVDGHERPDVVEYREKVFLPKWKDLSRRFVVFNENELGEWEFPAGLRIGEKPLVLVTHDESTFNANDGKRRLWVKDGKMPLRQKSRGKGIMVSGFLTPGGPLRVPDEVPDSELLEDLYCKWPLKPDGTPIRDAFVYLEYGKDNYWTGEKMVEHLVKIAIPIFRKAFPCCQALFAFDNASNHMAYADDALVASRMNLSPGGANVPRMREGFIHGKGLPQQMVFSMNNENAGLRGKPKGIEQVLRERGLWRDRNPAGLKFRLQCPSIDGHSSCASDPEDPSLNKCCARKVLSEERDFKDQLGLLAEKVLAVGHKVIFYPKFHCELNFIERFWCAAKFYARENCKYSLDGLRKTIPEALLSVSTASILRYFGRCMETIRAYSDGLRYGTPEFGEHLKVHKVHRQVLDPSKY